MKRGIVILFIFMVLVVIPCFAADVEFTEEELEFIEDHPVITLGVDPHFAPFEFIDTDRVYKGIAKDYITLIEEKSGLKFEIIQDLTWDQAYEKAVERQIDVLPCVAKTQGRTQYFSFSEPYYSFSRVVVMSEDNGDVKDFDDLKGKTVAVQINSSHDSYLSDFEEITLRYYDNAEAGLKAVARGDEDYFIGNLAALSYNINTLGLHGMKYIELIPEENNGLHFAIRKDWPELSSIIDKSLASILKEEEMAIHNKWIGIIESKDYTALIYTTVVIVAILCIVAGVSMFWIIRLKKEIKKRIEIEGDLKVAKKEAEVANTVKSNFLARMSHEIRTPLNAITGLSYLVLNTELKQSQRTHLEKIRRASDTMLSIINDILDFSKIEAGKVEIENASFELDEVVRNVINIVSFKVEEKELNFTLVKDPNLPNFFYGDPTRISQVLINLLNNGIKFTSTGDITFNIGLDRFENDEYHITFEISDTGIGISESHLDQLFEPFVQEDASISRRFGGTGLGLSIVKNLVELMGGSIEVTSELDKGTTFIVKLRLKADLEQERKVKKGFEYIKDIKTLVLNKNMNSLNMVVDYLRSFSIDAEFTSSEDQFLNIIESNENKFLKPYDLVIIYDESTIKGGQCVVDSIKDKLEVDHYPKVIFVGDKHHDHEDDLLDDEYMLKEPFLPSSLYNGITTLFKFKVMASQVTRKVEDEVEKYDGRVLIVEDNKTNQLIAFELLKPLGIEIILADNGKIALDHLDGCTLILMDLHMPVMDGYEATKIIREHYDIPIIAMTADAIDGVKDKCESIGMTDFISKPFDPDRFIKKIKTYLKPKPLAKESLIDIKKGLLYMGGNKELYEKVKKIFIEEHRLTLEELDRLIELNEFKAGADLIHKIKSSVGSLGADMVRQTAANLQMAFESEDIDTVKSIYKKFNEQFETLYKWIEESI